jgi:hypothetical protein
MEIVSCAALVLTSIITASASALMSHANERPGKDAPSEETEVSMSNALMLPIVASCSLISLYLLWQFVIFQYLVVLGMCAALATALATCVLPLVITVLAPLGFSTGAQGVPPCTRLCNSCWTIAIALFTFLACSLRKWCHCNHRSNCMDNFWSLGTQQSHWNRPVHCAGKDNQTALTSNCVRGPDQLAFI